MAVEFTKEQRQAIESRGGSLIVAAAAGSGKTAVLVERVIRRLLEPEGLELREMLIVTFTNAAAMEMRQRIGKRLLDELALHPASRRLRRQLALLGSAPIQTVHSFCLGLLRQNFALLGLPPAFRLLEESESRLLKEQALEDTLEEWYESQGEDPDFLAALENFAEERRDKNLGRAVLHLYDSLMSHPDPEGFLDFALSSMESLARGELTQAPFCQESLAECDGAMAFWQNKLGEALEEIAFSPAIEKGYGPAFSACLEGAKAIREGAKEGWDACYHALSGWAKPRVGAVRGEDKDYLDRLKALRDGFSQEVERLREETCSRPLSAVQQEGERSLPILRGLIQLEKAFREQYRRLKEQRAALDFSDLEHGALALLYDQEGNVTPLARQVAQGIGEILVDEYQDSNGVQEKIFAALRGENGSLFMVGDVKQSIYRFRLAEPEIFVHKYYSYQDYEKDPQGAEKRLMLNQNFRSRREVLSLCNFIFSRTMSRSFGGVDYDSREALYPGAEYQGNCPAEVWVLDMKREKEPGEESGKALYEAAFTAKRVKALLKECRVEEKGESRPARPGDVAILLSSFTSKAPLYQKALEEEGIPCAAGGGDLFSTVEMAVMRSFLAIIDNPRQDIPLISVLRSPLFLFTPDELLTIRQSRREGDFYDALKESDLPRAKEFMALLHRLRQYAPDLGAGQLLSLIYQETGALGVFQALDGGNTRRRNLHRLYQLGLEYEKTGRRGLLGFLRQLEERAKEGERVPPEGGDGVALMSIHRSKGLEFPIVLLPDLSKRYNTDEMRQSLAIDKKLGVAFSLRDETLRTETATQMENAIFAKALRQSREEEERKLYVAMTRAREKLVLILSLPDAVSAIRQWAGALEGDKLPWRECAGQGSVTLLVGAPLLCHKGAEELRAYGGLGAMDFPLSGEKEELICHVQPYDPAVLEVDTQQAETEEHEREPLPDLALYRAMQAFQYPYEKESRLPSKLTPTALVTMEDTPRLEWRRQEARIRLYQGQTREQAMSRGTLIHRCMQLVQLENCLTPEGAAQELRRLQEGQLKGENLDRMPVGAISDFACSQWGKLARENPCLREYQFSALFSPKELGLGEEEEEEILMNGVMDLVIQTPEGAIILDFKSDRVNPGEEEVHAARYAPQLDIYARAYEKVWQQLVLKKVIYFLSSGGVSPQV